MTSPYALELLADARGAELRREAHASRLAALATCCHPSAWTRAARRAVETVARIRRSGTPSPACCAA